MIIKRLLVVTLISALFPVALLASGKSKRVTNEEIGSYSDMAEKEADKAKIKKFKFACDSLVDFDWGDSPKIIKKQLGKKIIESDDESIVLASEDKNLTGQKVLLFEDGGLVGVSFVLDKEYKGLDGYVRDFDRVSKYINELYGSDNCIQAEAPRNILKKAAVYGEMIASGGISFTDMWLVNDRKTFISHYLERNEEYGSEDNDLPVIAHVLVVMDGSGIEIEEVQEEALTEESAGKEGDKKTALPDSKDKNEDKKIGEGHNTIKKYKGACIDLVPFNWGDSVDVVKKQVQWPLIADTGNSLFYKGYYCKRTAEVEYIFENNKLTQVCYAFNIPNDKNEDYINDYNDICEYIYERLGNCVHADIPDGVDEDPENCAKQVIKGTTEITMMYSFGKGATGVRHFMRKMTTDDGSKPDCPVDHFIGVWNNTKKNLHKDLELENSEEEDGYDEEEDEGEGEYEDEEEES